MIPIAHPLAKGTTEQMIAALANEYADKAMLVTGIKKCLRHIEQESEGLLVLTADTTPMDLITHLPSLCEERGIKYVFVNDKACIPNRFTCVFFGMQERQKVEAITAALDQQ
ncbi:putative ribosomal protein [Ordospora pajunii]|jgi:H/ACA ribonucleoprotein complex subunit 2|uniref:putative ribosomal protein n=1 Tax=Ordospora pajunii TaxID=3039483 RepID=UPI0029527DBD|nr:putative ribosomal protein [Ordospora pajunii]KAH9410620.1 putative ribosomal protein [Ordospora pajunii]